MRCETHARSGDRDGPGVGSAEDWELLYLCSCEFGWVQGRAALGPGAGCGIVQVPQPQSQRPRHGPRPCLRALGCAVPSFSFSG